MPTKAIPGPTGLAALRAVGPLLRDPLEFITAAVARYGQVVGVGAGPLRAVLLAGAAANRYILVEAADNFLVAPFYDRLHARWLVGEGLVFIDDPTHRQVRRLLLPAFHRRRIAVYQATMRAETAAMLDDWRPWQPIDLAAAMHHLTLRIMGHTLFGVDLDSDVSGLSQAVATLSEALGNQTQLLFNQVPFDVPGLGKGGSVRRAQRQIRTTLAAVVADHTRSGADSGDVVSLLVAARDEDGGQLTPDQLLDNLTTLFFAGHETSANALTWAGYLLARHPRAAARLYAELDTVLQGRPPTPADLDRLPYLDAVVKETLRLYPPLPVFYRVARAAFTWQGYTIPAGTFVLYSPYISHRLADQFPDPERFRPERFAPEAAAPPPYAYLPFAVGPRSCIGAPFAMMEIKTILAGILQRYHLDLVPKQRVRPVVRATLQPQSGLWVRVTARSTAAPVVARKAASEL